MPLTGGLSHTALDRPAFGFLRGTLHYILCMHVAYIYLKGYYIHVSVGYISTKRTLNEVKPVKST